MNTIGHLPLLILCFAYASGDHLNVDDLLNTSDLKLFPYHVIHYETDLEHQTLAHFQELLDDDELLASAYNRFQLRYGEKRTSTGIHPTGSQREKIFKDNLVYIFEHNLHSRMKRISLFEMGVNKFADMSLEEFRMERLGLEIPDDFHHHELIAAQNISRQFDGKSTPTSFDWRSDGMIGPVKDQLNCGACVMFAITSSAECLHAIHSTDNEIRDYSEQFMLDCAIKANGYMQNKGCEGNTFGNTLQFAVDHGFVDESSSPYEAKVGTCTLDGVHRISHLKQFERLPDSADAVKSSIHQNGPVSFGIWVYRSFMFYKTGIYDMCMGNPIGGHAMAMVGFKEEARQQYYIVKNQWGPDWGEKGFVRYIATDARCGLHKLAYRLVF